MDCVCKRLSNAVANVHQDLLGSARGSHTWCHHTTAQPPGSGAKGLHVHGRRLCCTTSGGLRYVKLTNHVVVKGVASALHCSIASRSVDGQGAHVVMESIKSDFVGQRVAVSLAVGCDAEGGTEALSVLPFRVAPSPIWLGWVGSGWWVTRLVHQAPQQKRERGTHTRARATHAQSCAPGAVTSHQNSLTPLSEGALASFTDTLCPSTNRQQGKATPSHNLNNWCYAAARRHLPSHRAHRRHAAQAV